MGDGAVHDNDKRVMVEDDFCTSFPRFCHKLITMHQMSTYVEEKKSNKAIN
jgi:hypothetical protein